MAAKIKLEESQTFEKVAEFHKRNLESIGIPSHLTDSYFQQMRDNIYYLSTDETEIFFICDKISRWKDVDGPIIQDFTILGKPSDSMIDMFIRQLAKINNTFLFLIESYNTLAKQFLSILNPISTEYNQQKFLCNKQEVKLEEHRLPDNVKIRNFRINYDEARYTEFYNKVLGFLGKIIDETFVSKITSRPSFDPQGYFIAEKNNHTVGFLALEKEPWGETGSRFGYIYQIGVDDNYRNTGLADALLHRGISFAKKKGIEKLGIGVREDNIVATKFVEKRGFRFAYAIRGYIVNLKSQKSSL